MKKRTLALIMALVLMLSVAIPGTLAVSLDASSTETTFSLDTEAAAPIAETPAEEAEPLEEAPVVEAAPVAEEPAEEPAVEEPAPADEEPVVEDEESTETEETTEETEETTEETEESTEETEESTEETEESTEETEESTEETEEPVEEVVTETVSRTYTGIIDHAPAFTSAGPLIVYDTPALMSVNEGIMLLADNEETPSPTPNTSGLELSKKAAVSADGNGYTITLEAYATGESVTTYVKDGVDIVLMLDLSQYMGKATTTTTETTQYVYTDVDEKTNLSRLYTNSQSETVYYYKSGDDYYEVDISRTESGGGGGKPAPPSGGKDYTYSITYTNNGTTNTIVSGKDGDTQLRWAGNYGSSVELYTRTTETETITTTTYDTSDLTKLTALKTAVNNFIDKVHTEAPASRIAIVTYADNAEVKSGTKAATDGALVTVNDAGQTALKAIVNGLTIQGGASNSHYAAADAVKIFQAVPTTSAEYKRERVAILFSAGIPGTGWATENKATLTTGNSIAQATMTQAYILKSDRGTTVTAPSGNVDGGAAWGNFSETDIYKNTVCTGCGATVYCVGLDIPTSGDPAGVDMHDEPYKSGALANEYFWRTSSHRLNGTHIFGSEAGYTNVTEYEAAVVAAFGSQAKDVYNNRYENTSYGSLYYFYPDSLTRNQTNGYYLTATSTDQTELDKLNNIFTSIAGQIVTEGGSSTTLDSSTVIKDIITPQFKLPEGTDVSKITIKTYKYNGPDQKWTDNNDAMGAEATITSTDASDATTTNNQVSVTGFNFSENWVGTSTNNGTTTYHGNKLVISFTVSPREGFLGGNAVLTNDEDSGVYLNKDANTPLDRFEQPGVDLSTGVNVTDVTTNVYLGGYYSETITADQIKAKIEAGLTCNVNGVNINFSQRNYGLESWQNEYVTITVEIKDGDGNIFTGDIKNLTDDVDYTVTVTVTPTKEGTVEAVSGNGKDIICVFKPELTFKDSEVYYGDTAPESYEGNLTRTRWVHYITNTDGTKTVDKVAYDNDSQHSTVSSGVTMLETNPPTLTLTYTPDAAKIADGKINSKADIPVDVKVEIGSWDVTQYVSFEHTDCTGRTCTVPEGKEFLLHVKTCSLTITKAAGKDTTIGSDEYFVFNVKKDSKDYTQVVIKGTGSVTLSGLPVGAYTVEEDSSTAWRYSEKNVTGNGSLSSTNPNGSLTCTNGSKNEKWLNHFAQVINTYGVKPDKQD